MTDDLVKVPDPDIELVNTEKRLAEAVGEAEVRFELLQRLMVIGVKRTFSQDWVAMGNSPYLTAAGAERLRPLFGISLSNLDSKRYESKDQEGRPRFMYVITATARFRGDEFAAVGTASSTDQFFATRRDAQGQPYTLPADQVDEQLILKSAYGDCIRTAVVRILGLRGLTFEQLESFGFDRTKMAKVEFRSGSSGRSSGARGGVAARTPVSPTPAAAPPEAPANGQNGATGVAPEVQALQQAISATTGEPYDAPASLSLLQSVTAFKEYQGTRSWDRVRPQAALVSLERLRKAREKQQAQQAQAAGRQQPLGDDEVPA